MRRTTTILAALTTGAALVLGTAAPALAAQGTLRVSGKTYVNPPQGCYTGVFWPLIVGNGTNAQVTVYDDHRCQGNQIGRVRPYDQGTFEFGGSVYVPR